MIQIYFLLTKNINSDLELLFDWLCANRLSLNVGKTEFVIFRPARSKRSDRVTLKLNNTTLFESSKIKYLGLILDPNLRFNHHIFELEKKLNRGVGLLYKLRRLKCNTQILKTIYFSLFQSHASYGLSSWGTSNQYLETVFKIQKRAIRAIAGLDFQESTTDSFRDLCILKISDLFLVQYASLMWDYDHDSLPNAFKGFFTKISDVHSYRTRAASANKLAKTINIKTKVHGSKLFKVQGIEIFNELKNLDFYGTSRTKHSFISQFKKYLIDKY